MADLLNLVKSFQSPVTIAVLQIQIQISIIASLSEILKLCTFFAVSNIERAGYLSTELNCRAIKEGASTLPVSRKRVLSHACALCDEPLTFGCRFEDCEKFALYLMRPELHAHAACICHIYVEFKSSAYPDDGLFLHH